MTDSPYRKSHASPFVSPNRYEEAVTTIRAGLRDGKTAQAGQLFGLLARALLPHIQRRAEAALGRYGRELSQDGIAEAVTLLWQRISEESSQDKTLHLEVRFWQAFKMLLLDAFRSVRTKKYGFGSGGNLPERLDSEAFEPGESPPAQSGVESFAAPQWEATFYVGMSGQTVDALLAQVPDKRWAEALQMENDGWSREEIAAYFGTSVRTVFNWTEKAKALVKAYLLETCVLDRESRPIL